MDSSPDAQVGTLSAKFSSIRRLGAGAEGGTWVANDVGGRSVVLKHVGAERTTTVARAFEVLRAVSSPHLPAPLELIDDGSGGVWLVTGFVEGEQLGAGPVPLEQALSEVLGVAHALAAIHQMGTHHGDVSANNVIVTPTRGVVLTDLGQLGSYGCGTPGFLAPEVLAGFGGPEADRFGVGSLLCLRIFGQVPWQRPEAVVALRDLAGVRRRLRALSEASQVDIPAALSALLERLLHPEPSRRVADADLLVDRLRELHRASLAGDQIRARSAWWLPNRWSFVGPRAGLSEALAELEGGQVKLVAVAGPSGSGRGRIVEELIASLQLLRTRDARAGAVAQMSDPSQLAHDLSHGLGDEQGSGDWLESWVGASEGSARVWGTHEAPPWPGSLADSVELQAAVLQAGAGLGRDALLLPVNPDLGAALAAAEAPKVRVLEVRGAARGHRRVAGQGRAGDRGLRAGGLR